MLVDSHTHLEAVDDLEGSLERAKEAGVVKILTIGSSLDSSKKAIEIAQKYSSSNLRIYATCGIHPQDGKDEVEKLGLYRCIDTLKQILNQDPESSSGLKVQDDGIVVAIGECGLDYYLDGEKRLETVDRDKKFQRELFVAQIELAKELNLPLVVHCRNAWNAIFDLLSKHNHYSSSGSGDSRRSREVSTRKFSTSSNNRLTGVFHSWTGDWLAAQKALGLGFYISFSGIVTFKNAPEVQEVAKKMPLDRMLVETDSPFLSPEPIRGEKNEPKNVRIVGKFLAHLRGLSFDIIAKETCLNAQKLFK